MNTLVRDWKVTFVADYAVVTTNIAASHEDEAIELAEQALSYHHGLNVSRFYAEAEPVSA